MVFVDASPVIYAVEQPPVFGQKAAYRLATLRAAGEQFAVTELIRMECLVGPVKARDVARLADFAAFFAGPDVVVLPINAAVAARAARIRATYKFQPMDSLHLAAAVEHGCNLFLTSDTQLNKFADILVELLS